MGDKNKQIHTRLISQRKLCYNIDLQQKNVYISAYVVYQRMIWQFMKKKYIYFIFMCYFLSAAMIPLFTHLHDNQDQILINTIQAKNTSLLQLHSSNTTTLFFGKTCSLNCNISNESKSHMKSNTILEPTNMVRFPTYKYKKIEHLFIMCLSHRGGFDRRLAIRNSWKQDKQNVMFFVGASACEIPHEARTDPWSCIRRKKMDELQMSTYRKTLKNEQLRLEQESQTHGDMVILPMKDYYRALPKKLKLAYAWSINNTQSEWFLKIDDDSAVRIGALEAFLSQFDSMQMFVIGSIRRAAVVPKSGKWAELNHNAKTYPPFANGAEGHVVSRNVAEHVLHYDGFEYQGEDVSLGIWISEMKLPVIWKDVSGLFVNHGDCYNENYIVIGHDISPDKMINCFKNKIDPKTKRIKTVYHKLIGRLGNQLFQTASILGIASRNKVQACLDGDEIRQYFEGLPAPCSHSRHTKKPKLLSEHTEYAKYHEFIVTENVEITGYLQSYRYFSHDLRSMLKFKQSIIHTAMQTLEMFVSKTLVGIHIRRYELEYLRNPSSQYFINAKHFFTSRYSAVQFIVTCQDIEWCNRQHFLSGANVYVVRQKNDAIMDMAILSACDHMILSVGTFGWWAAFLGADAKGGLVVYYNAEFVLEHPVNKHNVLLADFYPDNWIPLSSTSHFINTTISNNATNTALAALKD